MLQASTRVWYVFCAVYTQMLFCVPTKLHVVAAEPIFNNLYCALKIKYEQTAFTALHEWDLCKGTNRKGVFNTASLLDYTYC